MSFSRNSKQVASLTDWLRDAATSIDADINVRLWDGTVIAMNETVTTDIVLAINSPDVVRRLMFAPKLMTVVELYVERLIDVEGGTLIEAARSWDHMSILRYVRKLSKTKMVQHLWPFLRKAKTHDIPSAIDYRGRVENRVDKGRDDRDLIRHHYDVSNAFYELFLDPEMQYSCAYFETPDTSLEEAQQAKLDQICLKLNLQKGDTLLDIGCGWGGLACHAASKYGAHVHGVTLSEEQFAFAKAKVERMGLRDRITLELIDYRAIEPKQQYDKISQVEMFEHIGIDNHDAHFQRVHDLLRDRGLYFHQASTRMATKDLGSFRKPTAYQKFVTRYIFPGGELDYIGMTVTNMERFRLEVHDVQAMREHFALTLENWVDRLTSRQVDAIDLVGDAKTRVWLFYLSLFCISFERNTVGLFQVVCSKRKVGGSGLPLKRL